MMKRSHLERIFISISSPGFDLKGRVFDPHRCPIIPDFNLRAVTESMFVKNRTICGNLKRLQQQFGTHDSSSRHNFALTIGRVATINLA